MERKLFELKDGALSDNGTLEGYCCVFGNVDRGGDVIKAGAVQNMAEFVKAGALMIGHDWGGLGIGTLTEAKQDATGLWFQAQFHSDDEAQQTRQRVRERLDRGKAVNMSIGYETVKATYGEENGQSIRTLEQINVFEPSLVGVPMNPLAGATGAKSFEDEFTAALAAVRLLAQRAGDLKSLREADGRGLSAVNRSRIEALAAETGTLLPHLKSLLAEEPKSVSDEEMALLRLAMAGNMLALAG